MAYLAPIHQSSSVRQALKLNFLSPEEECLVVAKSCRLEIYLLNQDGLTLKHSKAIYGRVTMLNKIHPASSTTDHLFVGTDRQMYFTLSWDQQQNLLRTKKSYVDQADHTARDSQTGDRCHIDPSGSFMTLELYEGAVTVIPIVKKGRKQTDVEIGSLGEPVICRIPELFVRSSTFYRNKLREKNEKPKLALLFENNQRKVVFRTRQMVYTAGLSNGEPGSIELEDIPDLDEDLEIGASHLIPVPGPAYGVLVLGETSISYFENSDNVKIRRPLRDATIFVAWEQIDNQRFVLADEYGKLYLLMLEFSYQETIVSWKLDVIGETSKASVLVYLGNGNAFVGSHSGDCQVMSLQQQTIEIVQTLPNVAPILDFTIMDMGNRSGEGQVSEFSSGQARLVTGSGVFKDGSLRSVRSGVGLEDLGSLDKMENVTNLFSIKSRPSSQFVDTLVVSFIDETRVFNFSDDGDVEETGNFNGLRLDDGTLAACNVLGSRVLQVTRSEVLLSDLESGMASAHWNPSDKESITAVTWNDDVVVLVVSGSKLLVLESRTDSLNVVAERNFGSDAQIACVNVLPSTTSLCTVGFWESSAISILRLKDLQISHTEAASENKSSVPRSLLLANVIPNHSPTLFVGLADGTVVTYSTDIETGVLSNKKSVVLGAQQAEFRALPRGDGVYNVFATCEHPSLIYGSDGRLVFSAVTAENASCVCPFNAKCYPGSIAIATTEELKISLIDEEKSTHVQGLHVGETVRRIAYSPKLKAFGLGTIHRSLEDGVEVLQSNFKLADEVMFKMQATYALNTEELIESVMRCELNDGSGKLSERFVVGTVYVDDETSGDSVRGRIIIFEVTEDRVLKVVTEHKTKGACRCLAMVEDKIVAALVKTVVIFSLDYETPSSPFLSKCASYRTATAPIDLAVSGRLIAIADLMKSVSIVQYSPSTSPTRPATVKEIARHFQTTWSTAVELVDENTYLESDAEGNLLVLKQDVKGVTAEDRRRLQVTSEIGLGEVVNRIRRVDVPVAAGAPVIPRAFFATVEGSIYLFALIAPKYQDLLMRLQSAIASMVQSPGHIPFGTYRGVKNLYREQLGEFKEEPYRFVDGELVEQFSDLGEKDQEELVQGLGVHTGVNEVRTVVESLRRLR